MSDKFDEELKYRQIIGGKFTNRFIVAGAGAGKTKTIVDSIIFSLTTDVKEDRVLPSEVVAITFTNKAAAELRTRIFAKLNEFVDKEKDPEKLKELVVIRDNLSTMHISTIHSFCLRLLKEQAFLADLPIDMQIVMDNDLNVRYKDFYDDWCIDNPDKYYDGAARIGFLYCYDEMLFNMFKETAELSEDLVFATTGDEKQYKDRTVKYYCDKYNELVTYFFDAYVRTVNETFNTNYKDFGEVLNFVDDNFNPLISDKVKYLYTFVKCTNPNKFDGCKKAFNEFFDVKNGKIRPAIHGSKKTIRYNGYALGNEEKKEFDLNVISNWAKLSDYVALLDDYELFVNYCIYNVAQQLRESYIAYSNSKESSSKITQDKILEQASNLINKNPEAKKYFINKFKHIYVDEFQDTDKVQKDLIFGLFTDDMTEKLFDNCIFMVGDPKQSIYSFRGGDLKVYNEARETLTSQGTKPDIFEINFRSNKVLIDEVNRTFEDKFNDPNFNPSFEVNYDKMSHNKNADEVKGITGNEKILKGFYSISPKFIETEVSSSAKDNFAMLAEVIDFIKKNYKIERLIKGDKPYRIIDSIKDSDFLVLTKAKTRINEYARELKKHGIPVTMSGLLDFANEKAYSRLKALINFIANPNDQVAQYGALEVLNDKYAVNGFEEQLKAADILNSFYEVTKEMNSIEVLEYLCEHPEYVLDAHQENYEMVNYQSRLHQLLETVLEQQLTSKVGLADLLDNYINVGEQERELVIDEAENPVRFMNFHKSKGLEGKIVIIEDRRDNSVGEDDVTSYKETIDNNPVLYPLSHAGDYSRIKYRSFKSGSEQYEKECKRQVEEKLRLEYVALTRAEEAVVFMPCISVNTSFNNYSDLNERVKPVGFVPSESKESKPSNENEIKDFRTDEKKFEGYSIRTNAVVNPSLIEGESDNEIIDNQYLLTRVDNRFGNIMHRVFELNIISRWNKVPCQNKSIINKAIYESFDDARFMNLKDLSSDLNKLLDGFNKDPFILECLNNAVNVYTELPFTVNAFRNEIVGSNLIKQLNEKFKGIDSFSFNGRIDLLFELKNGKYVIVDYKSDKLRKNMEDHLQKKYSSQQELYMFALSKIKGCKIEDISYKLYSINKSALDK